MKNSIFKSYSKRILRSEAFISVIVVFVLALGIIGTSYALYMDVDTDTDYQLVEVGDLKIDFDNIDNSTNPEDYSKITLTNMTPMEDEIGTTQTDNIFSFRIYNTGTYTVDYDIKLVTADGNLVDSKYINFQLCKDDATNCGDVQTLSNISDSIIREDHISPAKEGEDASVYYFIRIWINNQYPIDTTEDADIVLRVLIEASNASGYLDNDNTLAGAILNNSKIKINNTTPSFTGVATEEEGLYKAADDYGTSYYFRGAQPNNYVSFAGFTWRVVRINGDGSVRLILDKTLEEMTQFNASYDDNAYVGYMYGTTGSDNYDDTHKNENDSTIKIKIDNFYKNNLLNKYSEYMADNIFCGDKTIESESQGYGANNSIYSIYNRLIKNADKTPTLKCAENQTNDYSRYTVNGEATTKGVATNGDLTYPIGLLSADELLMAGAWNGVVNNLYYLHNSNISEYWWTMSPSSYNEGYAYALTSNISDNSLRMRGVAIGSTDGGIRPVINLKADTLVNSGDGTSGTPYTIK